MEPPLCLLLVEDDFDDVALLRHALRGVPQAELSVASTLAEAERAAPRADAVLLDLGLPDGSGLDSIERVRRAAPETALIVLTGNEEADFGLEAVRRGADDFLQKGTFDASVLRRAVRYALERRRFQQRELELAAMREQLEALKRGESAQRDFTANVSHELRTPVTAIKGYAETLLQPATWKRRTTATRFLRVIIKHAAKLEWLIDQLLAMSAMDFGETLLAGSAVDLAALLREQAEALGALCVPKEIALRVEAERAAKVRGDRSYLAIAIENLLSNAVKFTPTGGAVRVRCRREGGEVVVSVQDTGPGIPPDELPRVFERFYRGAQGRSSRRGTGLGLHIAKRVVELHGGTLGVESAPGRGSTFTARLPAVKAARPERAGP